MDRPFTTLFMLSSVDGKISTGNSDERDFDKDLKQIEGTKEGLKQYYDIEKTTDEFSMNSGKVMAKIGVNGNANPINSPDVNFIIIDNKHLTSDGIKNLSEKLKHLYLVTNNENHPAFDIEHDNLTVIFYDNDEFTDLFKLLKEHFEIERITIQTGGSFNAAFLRENLIDQISLVIAPALIGGKDTSTLIDGESLVSEEDLKHIKSLKLEKVEKLENSYLHLVYSVNK